MSPLHNEPITQWVNQSSPKLLCRNSFPVTKESIIQHYSRLYSLSACTLAVYSEHGDHPLLLADILFLSFLLFFFKKWRFGKCFDSL